MSRSAAIEPDRVLVLQHEQELSAGLLGEWTRARGLRLDVRPAQGGWEVHDLSPFGLVCSLGSHEHADDDELPWLERELDLLRRAQASEVPVLGICFGAQSLARALGGTTGPAPRPEVDWIEVEMTQPGSIPAGPWPFWHVDRFEVPPGGELLARTDVGPAAFRLGSALGVQFHPELTEAGLERMIDGQRGAVGHERVAALRAGVAAEPARLRERAWALYDGLIGAATRSSPEERRDEWAMR